jgi:SprT protein
MTPAEPELRRQVIARSHRLLRRAEQHFARRLPCPEILFDLRGQAAGQARIAADRTTVIRFNQALLNANPKPFLAQTVPHEVAHLVAFHVFGLRIRPHGPEWQSVMMLFDAHPQRCHSFALEEAPRRRLAQHTYHCGCRAHTLSSIRHNRVRRGQRYYCRVCGQLLVPDGGRGAE